MWHLFQWTGTVAVWITFVYQLRSIVKFRRIRREGMRSFELIIDETGLSELQAKVALDAAMATFMQRVTEMQEANRGRSNQ